MRAFILAVLLFSSSAHALIHVPFTVTVESFTGSPTGVQIGAQYSGFVDVDALVQTAVNVPGLGNLYTGKALEFYFDIANIAWDSTVRIFQNPGPIIDGKTQAFHDYFGPCAGGWCTPEQRAIWSFGSDDIGFILTNGAITAILGGAFSPADPPLISLQGNRFGATTFTDLIRGSLSVGAVITQIPEPPILALLLIGLIGCVKPHIPRVRPITDAA